MSRDFGVLPVYQEDSLWSLLPGIWPGGPGELGESFTIATLCLNPHRQSAPPPTIHLGPPSLERVFSGVHLSVFLFCEAAALQGSLARQLIAQDRPQPVEGGGRFWREVS